MTIPSVSLPVPFEQIPAEVERLRTHSRALQGEVRVTAALIDAVQECCPHTNKVYVPDGYGDGGGDKCPHCGKSW